MARKLIFKNPMSPGDVVVSSALIRDLHAQYPGQFITDYTGTVDSWFWNNSHITKLPPGDPEAEFWRMQYEFIHQPNQRYMHFMHGYYHDFNLKFGLNVRLQEFKPDVHFDAHELSTPIVSGRYWVVCAGGKRDYTTKWWDPSYWQKVVDLLQGKVQFVQVGETGHFHPPLSGVLDLRGKTTFRELVRLILHSDGVCSVVTCLMHIAAACNRPAVVVAGGREGWWWEAYTRKNRDANMKALWGPDWKPPQPDDMIDHVFLHTVGKHSLPCCSMGGCWKSRTTDGEPKDRCLHLMQGPTIRQPACLTYIKPDEVARAVDWYRDGPSAHNTLVEGHARKPIVVPADIRAKIDTDILETPITICTLLFGKFPELARRNLESIVGNTDPKLFKLRIGLNEVCDATRAYVTAMVDNTDYDITVFDSADNIKKYPMMRRMFHSAEKPLDTRWVVWLDDDSHFIEPDWLTRLSHCIRDNYQRGFTMYGKKYFFDISASHIQWIKDAKWYGGMPFPLRDIKDKTTGRETKRTKVDFATGGFWAVEAKWLQSHDWPDTRINHNGGDIMMGAAIYQTGGQVKNWDYGVKISDAPRRGFSEKVAGTR